MNKAILGTLIGVGVLAAFAGTGFIVSGMEEQKDETVSISSFSELNVSSESADIILKKGSVNQVHYQLPEGLVPEIKEENGKLTITSKRSGWHFFQWNTKKCQIEITMTEDALKNADITVTSGDINFSEIDFSGSIHSTSGDIVLKGSESGGDLSIKSTSGDLRIENCVFGKLNCDHTSGDVVMKKVQVESLTHDSTSGDLTADELNVKQVKVSGTSGDINLQIPGTKDSYNFDLSCTSGDIKLGDTESGERYKENHQADQNVEISTTSGDITIRFFEQ